MSARTVSVQTLHEALGTLAIGAYLNTALFALELTQLYKYVRAYPSERWSIRLLVAVMASIDLLATANACCMVYLYTVVHWGDAVFMGQQNFTIPIYSLTFAASVILMHGFLIYRYIMLSRNYIVAAILSTLAGAAFVGDCLATWSVIRFTSLEDRPVLKTYATIWLTCSSGADLLIALALIWQLKQVKSTFSKTQSLIRRLIRTAIMTGLATATIAILALTTYLAKPTSNLCLTFGICIGRACTLTVLYNLNTRKDHSGYTHNDQTGAFTNTVPLDTGFNFSRQGATNNGGINVHQMSVVHVDNKAGNDGHSYDGDDQRFDQKPSPFAV